LQHDIHFTHTDAYSVGFHSKAEEQLQVTICHSPTHSPVFQFIFPRMHTSAKRELFRRPSIRHLKDRNKTRV